jgi:hypothetical protein
MTPPRYVGPSAAVYERRMAAAKLALNDLTPETQAMVDDLCAWLQTRYAHVGPLISLEIVAAMVMAEEIVTR